MAEIAIRGFAHERFARVRAAFEKNFALDLELGACFSLAIEGETVVDLWAGFADPARTRPWQKETIAPINSSAKVPMTLCGLMLLDRGLIELDEPVARYWPEFAQAGKADVLVRHIFCHSSGVGGFDPPYDSRLVTDWDHVVARLAAQAPWWKPGTETRYHGMTFHALIGELIRRTTGMLPDQFLREEVTDRIAADYVFAVPDSELSRLAEPDREGFRNLDEDSYAYRAAGAFAKTFSMGDPRMRRSPVNGFAYTNARSMTRICSILACGGSLDGQFFLSPETVHLAHQEHVYSFDPFMDGPVRRGLGVALASKEFPLPFPNAFHWGGYGGSSVIMEPDRKVCWSYIPTKMDDGIGADERGSRLAMAACADSNDLI